MDAPDFRSMVIPAKLSALVYQTSIDALAAGCIELGLRFGGLVTAPGFQVMLAETPGRQYLVYRGTPVTCGRDIFDAITALGFDAGLSHAVVGAGRVLSGPYRAVADNWNRTLALLTPGKKTTIVGHSLGAVSALFAQTLLPGSDATVFAPFQAADAAFWKGAAGPRVTVARARDFAPGHNHADPVTCLAGPLVHLDRGAWGWAHNWPWIDESIADHAVEDYVADILALAAKETE